MVSLVYLAILVGGSRKQRIKWLQASSSALNQLDENLLTILVGPKSSFTVLKILEMYRISNEHSSVIWRPC